MFSSQEIEQETKKQAERGRSITPPVKVSSILLENLFNEMTSFLQDSVANGFHTTLLATGDLGRWRAREQYVPRMSAVSNPPFELQNAVNKAYCTRGFMTSDLLGVVAFLKENVK